MVRSLRQGVAHTSGNGHDGAALLQRGIRGDEGAGFFPRLDDDDEVREAADDAVPLGKMIGKRQRAGRLLREDAAFFRDFLIERPVFLRIADIRPASQNGKGPPAGGESSFVGMPVNAEGHAADDLNALRGQLHTEPAGDPPPIGRAHPRAHDRHGGQIVRGESADHI